MPTLWFCASEVSRQENESAGVERIMNNEASGVNMYIFHRKGLFYPMEFSNDAVAIQNAECNLGTLKVTRVTPFSFDEGEVTIWENKRKGDLNVN